MPLLQCVAQSYAWGKHGHDSLVAQLKARARAGGDAAFQVDPSAPYAELWMGTHPNGPSRVVRNGEPAELLSEWLEAHPEAFGATASRELPFLFKVLSVQKALSIQAHPDAALARELHATKPALYKDPNHKPEMTIALTRFEALSQFRDTSEIVAHLNAVPELRALVDDAVAAQFLAAPDATSLRALFKSFIYADDAVLAAQLTRLCTRLAAQDALAPIDALVLRLHSEYGVDIGCFCPYLLNYVTLAPGDAVFLGANEPHAYLSGDCIECMACSDNVVRAGLTPKYIDKVTLYEMLTYRTGPPEVFAGDKVDDATRLYAPPVPEFQVEAIALGANAHYALRALDAPSVLLVTSGSCSSRDGSDDAPVALARGAVFFIPAGQQLDVRSSSDGVTAFRASPNERSALL